MRSTSTLPSLIRLSVAASCLALAGTIFAADTVKSPETVKIGLRIVNQVVGHTGRLIASKTYQQIPREEGEFMQGSKLLHEAVAGEPAAFKAKVEMLLSGATQAADAMSAAAKAQDDAKLASTHETFAAAVKNVVEAFPQDLRPSSNPRRGPGAGGRPGER